MKRRTPMKRVNSRRRKKRREEQFGEKADWIRQLNCVACGFSPCDPAHVRSRAAGGSAKDLVPLCHPHHREQHDSGIKTFSERYGLDLPALAEKYELWWIAHQDGTEILGF